MQPIQPLTISRPNCAAQLTLYPVEHVMPLIQRLFKLNPSLNEVADSAFSCLDEIGNRYGGEYIALVPIEPDGNGYLPLHCRRVLSVSSGLNCGIGSSTYVYGERNAWSPPSNIDYIELVADQVGPHWQSWRAANLERLSRFPWLQQGSIPYQRTSEGIFLQQFRTMSNVAQHPAVIVCYEGDVVDARGFPLITRDDMPAVAQYWNYERIHADVYAGNRLAIDLYSLAEANKEMAITVARNAQGITDQQFSEILRQTASWDRPTFAHGFQPSFGNFSHGGSQLDYRNIW